MNHFENVKAAPADPILGLNDAFKAETAPHKINLGVGVFQDASGKTPTLKAVHEAEARLVAANNSKGYLPISGQATYVRKVQELTFGANSETLLSGRVASLQTPGGTGALRVASDFLSKVIGSTTIWVSDPTWANHTAIFAAAGLQSKVYPYFDPARNGLDFDSMLAAFNNIPPHDVVLLHGACHNPTGADPSPEQWQIIAEVCRERSLLPLLDFAYQGFGNGLEEDAASIRAFNAAGVEFLVCSSFSKNFGLYNERIGALHAVASDKASAERLLSQLKVIVRSNYSNPPAHGAEIVATILSDAALRQLWEDELTAMREHIRNMRELFVQNLAAAGIQRDFSFIRNQLGMFSFSGLTPDQVERLRSESAIYMVKSGRINVAGITPDNVGALCKAIARVL